MSIRINKEACAACGKCRKVCPGNLIYTDEKGRAFNKYPKDCWGCAACLKECSYGAIQYYLGADIGGKGAHMHTRQRGGLLEWVIERADGDVRTITIHRKESNKY